MPQKTHRRKQSRRDENKMEEEDKASLSSRKSTHAHGPSQAEPTREKRHDRLPIDQPETTAPAINQTFSNRMPIPASAHVEPPSTRTLADGVAPSPTSPAMPIGSPREYVSPSIMLNPQPLLVSDGTHGPAREAAFEALDAAIASGRSATLVSTPLSVLHSEGTSVHTERHALREDSDAPVDAGMPVTGTALARDAWSGGRAGMGTIEDSSTQAVGSAVLLHALRPLLLHARPHGAPFQLQPAGARALRGVSAQTQVRLEPAHTRTAFGLRGTYAHAHARRQTQTARRARSLRSAGATTGVWCAHAHSDPLARLQALAPPPSLPPLPSLRANAAHVHTATAAGLSQSLLSPASAGAATQPEGGGGIEGEVEGDDTATHRGEGSPAHAPAHSPRRDALFEEAYGAPQSDEWAASVGQRLRRVLSRETRVADTLVPPSAEQAAAGIALPASEADACVYVRSPRLTSEPNYLASVQLVTAPTLAADALARVQRMLAGDAVVDSEAVPAEGLTDGAHGAGACACGAPCAFGLGMGGPGWMQPGTWTGNGSIQWGAASGAPQDQLLDGPQALSCLRCRRSTLGSLGRAAVGARRFLCEESDELAEVAATRRSRSRAAETVEDVDRRWREKMRAQLEALEDGAEEQRQGERGTLSSPTSPGPSAGSDARDVAAWSRLDAARMAPNAASTLAPTPQTAHTAPTQAQAPTTGSYPAAMAESEGRRVGATEAGRAPSLRPSLQPAPEHSTSLSVESTAARAMAARAARAALPATAANTTATTADTADSGPDRTGQGQDQSVRAAGPTLQSAADVAPPGASGAGVQPQQEPICSYGWGLPQFVSVDVVRALAEVARRTGAAASTVDAILSRARYPYPNYRIAPYQSWPRHVPLRKRSFRELFPHADTYTGYRPSGDVTDQPSLPALTPAPPASARTPDTLNTRLHSAAAAAPPPLPSTLPATAAPAAAAAATTAHTVAALRGQGLRPVELASAAAPPQEQSVTTAQASRAGTKRAGTGRRHVTSRPRHHNRAPLWQRLASRLPPLALLAPLQRLQRHLHWPQGHPHAPAAAMYSRHHGAPQSQYSPPLSAIDDLYSDRRPAAAAAGDAERAPAAATTFVPLPARAAEPLPDDHSHDAIPPPPTRSRLGLLPGAAAAGVDLRPAGPLPASVVSTARVPPPVRTEAADTSPAEPDMWIGEESGPEYGSGRGRRGQRDDRKEEKDDGDDDRDAARKLPPKRAPGAEASTRSRSRGRCAPAGGTEMADAGTSTLAMPPRTQSGTQVAVNTAFPPTMAQPLLPHRRDIMPRNRARERPRVGADPVRQAPASFDARARTTSTSARPSATAPAAARDSLEDYLTLRRQWPRYSLPARLLACRHASPRDYDTPADAPIAPGATVVSRARALAAFLLTRLQRLRAGIAAGLPLHDAVKVAARNSGVCTVCRQASGAHAEQQPDTIGASGETGTEDTSSHVSADRVSISGTSPPETPFSPAFVADFAAEPVQTTSWTPPLQRPSARATVRDTVSGPLLGLTPEPPEVPSPAASESGEDELALLVGAGAKSAQAVAAEVTREEADEGANASANVAGHDLHVSIRGARDVSARLAQAGSVLEREEAETEAAARGSSGQPLGYMLVPQRQPSAVGSVQSPPATVADADHEEEAEDAPDDQWALESGYHVYGEEAGEDGVAEEERAREQEAASAARAAREAEERYEHVRLLSAEDRDTGETARGWRGKGNEGERDEEKDDRRTAPGV